MANAAVEKIKGAGLRHGEKVVVALTAALCFVLLVKAATLPTIDLTPEQVKKAAEAAESNLNRSQNPEDIVRKLEGEGITDPGFVKIVEEQSKSSLNPSAYKIAQAWVTPEPGAGLIRDTPELIAATDLYAYPGRGGAAVYELDAEGKRIQADPNQIQEPVRKMRLGRRRRRRQGAMPMGAPRRRVKRRGTQADYLKQVQQELEEQNKRRAAQLVGKAAAKSKDTTKEEEDELAAEIEAGGPWKDTTQGLRWVAITGVLDQKKLRENYYKALKRPESAHPNYKRLDVQRQERQPDGSWPADWTDVDLDRNLKILDNLTEVEVELTPPEVRLEALVDPLPFLEAGSWEKVHVASLVPPDMREVAPPPGGLMARGRGGRGGPAFNRQQLMLQQNDDDEGPQGLGGMGGGGPGGPGGGVTADSMTFEKSEAETLMVRSLDFTVDPDTTYRYRLRLVVFNPNIGRQDVNPGVDTKTDELTGPWSEPTPEVTMPADVTPYAMRREPGGDGVLFQVLKWNPEDGVTVVRDFITELGDIIGYSRTTAIPSSDGTPPKNKNIDYISRQILLDATGGIRKLPPLGVGSSFEIPALSLLVRPDGSVTLRSEARDMTDDVRQDIARNYLKEVDEKGLKKGQGRQSSMGVGAGMRGGIGGIGGIGGVGGIGLPVGGPAANLGTRAGGPGLPAGGGGGLPVGGPAANQGTRGGGPGVPAGGGVPR